MIYPFSTYLYKDENEVVAELLDFLSWSDKDANDVQNNAINLIEEIRSKKSKGGQLEAFLQEFSLNSDEGLALMCLAEALLRIPDAKTSNALINDKVAAANWLQNQGSSSDDWVAKAAGIGMAITSKTLNSKISKLSEPIIRHAMINAMQMMGNKFVLGTDIEDAIKNAKSYEKHTYKMSYDMLGEAARDQDTADRYYKAYKDTILKLSDNIGQQTLENPSISIKLSALHPRYTYSQKERCVPELIEKLKSLALLAASHDMPLTIDAEEANRLDLSIEVIDQIISMKELDGWDGFGLAVQAYQKRALPLIKYLAQNAREKSRKIQIRLVKGAYWDSEIKHAQMGGFPEYPVFTRKNNTDLSYLACVQHLFANLDVIYPMFATHNAHTIAAIQHMAEQNSISSNDYEFQRLHGMGERLYSHIIKDKTTNVRVYAPVGKHKDLLPYLVRRLLENGANSSFVNHLLDKNIKAEDIAADPITEVCKTKNHRHPKIPLPKDIFGETRKNSKGIDLDDPLSSQELLNYITDYKLPAPPEETNKNQIDQTFERAKQAFPIWNKKDVQERSAIIKRFSGLLEQNSQE